MRRFRFTDPDFETAFSSFVDERRETLDEVDAVVRDVIAAVRAEGLPALLRFARDFDGVDLDERSIRVSQAEIDDGAEACPAAVREAIAFAAERIRSYHARQRPADLRFTDEAGVELGWRWTPIEAVGIYVPGGRAAYPSTVLMNAVPATVAGVERIAMVTPPGRLQPAVLAAAKAAGVHGDLAGWRRPGGSCAGLRRRADPRSGQDRRPWATPSSRPPSVGSTAWSGSTP